MALKKREMGGGRAAGQLRRHVRTELHRVQCCVGDVNKTSLAGANRPVRNKAKGRSESEPEKVRQ
jgi:hypothetical protein